MSLALSRATRVSILGADDGATGTSSGVSVHVDGAASGLVLEVIREGVTFMARYPRFGEGIDVPPPGVASSASRAETGEASSSLR